MGEVRCNMLTGALVPRWGTIAGVPGPRRSADECDAGWFAPVATRRRPFYWGNAYSVFLNCAIAIPIIARPIAPTMDSDSHTGTVQLPHVTPGASRCCSPNDMFRWSKTARRIGPTTYVSGSILVSTVSQLGSPFSG